MNNDYNNVVIEPQSVINGSSLNSVARSSVIPQIWCILWGNCGGKSPLVYFQI